MEDRSSNPIPLLQVVDRAHSTSPVTISDGVLRSIRSEPPADFVLKIECFSSLSELGVDRYKSGIFETGGYKWSLSLYPEGNKKRGGDGYISLYLVLVDTNNNFPLGWEVNVNFKLFVYNQIQDKYMTVQYLNRKVSRFHKMKTRHGFAKLVSLAILRDESNGYLRNDTCIVGAEVFVIQNRRKSHHCLSIHDLPRNLSAISWELNNFSKLNKECYYSDVLSLGERKWKFEIYPKGDRLNKGRLSVHLQLVDSGISFSSGFNFMRWFRRDQKQASSTHLPFPRDEGFLVDFIFIVRDQLHDNDLWKVVSYSFDANWTTSPSIKCGDLALLSDITDQSKGYLVNDSMIVQAGFHAVCEVKNT